MFASFWYATLEIPPNIKESVMKRKNNIFLPPETQGGEG